MKTPERASNFPVHQITSSEIIGKGTWLDKVAQEVIRRETSMQRHTDPIRVESGLGASGIPHIGSLGDAIRAYGVKLALENAGFRSELIAFSDDMDGLRRIPEGFPSWLEQYVGKPVSIIPDPYDCHRSYGDHMSSLLRDALDRLSVKYTFRCATEIYGNGILKKEIRTILENSARIGKKISESLGQTKFEDVLPYYPLCHGCDRLYVAQAYEYLPGENKVRYRCNGTRIGERFVAGCGRDDEISVDEGKGKLSWKTEFAARWRALDIRFEAYGKDIADSVRINDWISDEILEFPHPHHVRYELFLDRSGRKISKSLGNVFTPQLWLKYGTPQSLMFLMFKRIVGTRQVSINEIPTYMDEYDWLEDVYFGKKTVENSVTQRRLKGLYEYTNQLRPPPQPEEHVPYRLLVQLARLALSDSPEGYVIDKLRSYGTIKQVSDTLSKRIALAHNWAIDLQRFEHATVVLSATEKDAIDELSERISREEDPILLQNAIYDTAKRHSIPPREFFKIIYRILVGVDQGPRLGQYIVDLGRKEVISSLQESTGSAS